MSALFGLTGLLGAAITLILIIIKIIKKQQKKKLFIAFLVFLVLFFIGLLIPSKTKEIPNEMTSTGLPASNDTQVPTNTPIIPTNTSVPTDTMVPTDTSMPTNTPIPTDTPMPTNTSIPTDIPLIFILHDGVIGDYGKEVILNSGTEFEEHEITYYIPVGNYAVTNLNTKGAGQVSVYCGGPEYDGEWQYFISDENCQKPIVVMANETKELTIKDGQFIVLSDNTDNFEFVLK